MNKKTKQEVVVGAGLAAVAAAAAGAYFLYGTKEGAKKRKQVKAWSLKMKAEVLEKIEKLKDLDAETYEAIVASVAKKYEQVKGIEVADVAVLTKELKSHWKSIKGAMHPAPKKKVAKKVAKKVTK